jgi:hypothetical protein
MRAFRLLKDTKWPVPGRSVTSRTVPKKTGRALPPNPAHPLDGTQEQAKAREPKDKTNNEADNMNRIVC